MSVVFRHCVHESSFICNCIESDAVTSFVYMAPIETDIENAVRSGAFSKRYDFIGRVNGDAFWHEIGWLAKSKHREPRTECRACLYIHIRNRADWKPHSCE